MLKSKIEKTFRKNRNTKGIQGSRGKKEKILIQNWSPEKEHGRGMRKVRFQIL